jgi:hypothetical protein
MGFLSNLKDISMTQKELDITELPVTLLHWSTCFTVTFGLPVTLLSYQAEEVNSSTIMLIV